MVKEITVRKDKIYGREVYYPDCPAAVLFAQLTGQKTISVSQLRIIQKLGYGVTLRKIEPETIFGEGDIGGTASPSVIEAN